MRKHLPKCSVHQHQKNDKEDSSNSIVTKGWSHEVCRKATVKMIILDELSFKFVENKGFCNFCSIASPKFEVSSQRTITRDAP